MKATADRFVWAIAAVITVTGLAVLSSGCRSVTCGTGTGADGGSGGSNLLASRGSVPPPYFEPGAEAEEPLPPPADGGFAPAEPLEIPSAAPAAAAPQEPEITLPEPVETERLSYQVKKGDTLWGIARRYGVTYQELAAYNDMDPQDTLAPGTELTIPPGGAPQDTAAEPVTTGGDSRTTVTRQPIPSDRQYEVEKGDNLWEIARRFGVTVRELKRVNNLQSDMIRSGQVLELPGGAELARRPEEPATGIEDVTIPATTPEQTEPVEETVEPAGAATAEPAGTGLGGTPQELPNLLEHTVMQGDSLEEIAEMYGTTVNAIRKANPSIQSNEDLVENMEIMVPFE